MTIFLLVARNGEMSLKEISREIKTGQSLVLRYVNELTAWQANGESGPGLLEIKEAGPLKKTVILTEKGLEVVKQIKAVTQH